MTPDVLLQRHPGETVRWLRGRLGLTQGAFARRLGVTPRTVRGWEEGAHPLAPFSRTRVVPLLVPQLATEAGQAWLRAVLGERSGG